VLVAYNEQGNILDFGALEVQAVYISGNIRKAFDFYTYSEVDHERLFEIASSLQGDFLMTYDHDEQVHQLARKHGFDQETIAMKNTHHAQMTELLIGRDLSWLRHR
jgi:DNA adenine methylase